MWCSPALHLNHLNPSIHPSFHHIHPATRICTFNTHAHLQIEQRYTACKLSFLLGWADYGFSFQPQVWHSSERSCMAWLSVS